MRRILYKLLATGAMFLLAYLVLMSLASMHSGMVYAHASSSLAIITPTATATASSSSGGSGGFDPAIIAAFIALGGGIIVAFVGGGFGIYQMRRNALIQKDIVKLQQDLQKQAQDEQLRLQHQQAQEIARLQHELQEQALTKERERQREETKEAAALAAMQRATTQEQRVQAYRDALRADPRIARLQILDMERPLEVTSIYVRVRLHQEIRLQYDREEVLLHLDTQNDPNAFFKVRHARLEQRVSSALEPDAAIRTHKRCVIVGDPGAGKTTLLKYLALKSVENQLPGLPDIPIHIELNAFASSGYQDLLDFAAQRWETRYGFPKTDARAYMEEQLRAGQAWLLLDALDETVIGETVQQADASYRRIADAIEQVATRCHQAHIVVTARKAGYHQHARLTGFTELEVLDFRTEDMQQFIRSWFDCHPQPSKYATAPDLIAKLARAPRIQALAANPLLLSLIVLVYEEQLDLPDRRAELYHRCVETLLTKWDTSRDIRRVREFKPERKRQLLEVIAWHFHLQGQRYFPESELLTIIAGFLPAIGLLPEQNARILEEIAAENGLLKEQAQGWYGFLHLTLQEYFVAQYATEHQELDTLVRHRSNPWWEEVILLYAGRVADASPLLERLLGQGNSNALREDIFWTNLILAGRCLATRPTILHTTLRNDILTRLFQALVQSPYALARKRLAEVLAEIGGKETNAHLLWLLADKQNDLDVRESIAQALGTLGERSVVSDLLRLLTDEQGDSRMRKGIAQALGMLGERSVVPDLLRLLTDEQGDLAMRWHIAQALGMLGERSVVPDLLRLLADEHCDPELREGIAQALGMLGERSVVPDLLRLLADEQGDSWVRCFITEALEMLGERSVVPDLLQLLTNEQGNSRVRCFIAQALGTLGEWSVVPDLLQLLADEQQGSNVCGSIAQALGMLGERSVVPDLLRLLVDEHRDSNVRGSIAAALGSLRERSVAPDLLRLLADEQGDWNVRMSIAEALGSLRERSVAPDLLRLLADEQGDWNVRGSIAEALGSLGEHSVVPDLLRLLADEQRAFSVRGSIAQALGKLVESEADILSMIKLLSMQSIADDVYEALWNITRREECIILKGDGADDWHIEMSKA